MLRMKPTQRAITAKLQRVAVGFTLLEMVMVLVMVGVLTIYALPNVLNMPGATLDSQAKSFASDLRRTQLLATVSGSTLCMWLTDNTHYSVKNQCTAAASTLTDPATNRPIQGTLINGVTFGSYVNPQGLKFNSLGQPSLAASYVFSGSTPTSTVNVTALTGYVKVTTP